ncbi:MAG: cytidylate kinase family protein [Thermodesulfobacteriota bacterium]
MPLITVTCTMGTGGRRIAQKAAEALHLDVYDDAKFQEAAQRAGIPAADRANLDERPPGFWGYIWRQKPEAYINLMESLVYDLAKKGQGVIVGHAGQILLSDFNCALHVLIFAPEERRTQQLAEQHKMSPDNAGKLIRKADHDLQGFFHFAFQKSLHDISLYDLVINTAKTQEDAAAKLIVEAAQSDAISECSLQALQSMEGLALAKRVEAAILKTELSLTQVNVEVPTAGQVLLTGLVYSDVGKDTLLKAVKGVPGVKGVRSEISIVPVQHY